MKKLMIAATVATAALMAGAAQAEDYVIDTKGAHAFVQFRIGHLGFSWLSGRFNDFSGEFSYDEKNPASAKVQVNLNVASIDSNHAERDKHLRSADFFEVEKYPTAKFVSTRFEPKGKDKGVLTGNLTIKGVTKPVSIDIEHIGAGKDPWGGFRRGFEGRTKIALKDFNINYDLGPSAREAELMLSIEGIRK